MERLEEKYKDTVIRRRNMWLFFIKDAKNVIADCQTWNIAINGLDAFLLSGRGIQPSMEHSLWFDDESKSNYSRAIDFLSRPENEEYLYEIWFEGYSSI